MRLKVHINAAGLKHVHEECHSYSKAITEQIDTNEKRRQEKVTIDKAVAGVKVQTKCTLWPLQLDEERKRTREKARQVREEAMKEVNRIRSEFLFRSRDELTVIIHHCRS